jgi:hypothetical protein
MIVVVKNPALDTTRAAQLRVAADEGPLVVIGLVSVRGPAPLW